MGAFRQGIATGCDDIADPSSPTSGKGTLMTDGKPKDETVEKRVATMRSVVAVGAAIQDSLAYRHRSRYLREEHPTR